MRRILAAMAILGMLVHGLALVRHHAAMGTELSADAAYIQALNSSVPQEAVRATGLQVVVICHAAADLTSGKAGDNHRPSNKSKCPICSGLCSAAALASSAPVLLAPHTLPEHKLVVLRDQRVEHHKRIRPPGRGPPALV